MEIGVGIAAVVIAVVSLWFSHRADRRTQRAARIQELLGDKQTVAFGASKLLWEGFPEDADRPLVVRAVVNAYLFSSSDRARGMLLAALDEHRDEVGEQFGIELTRLTTTYDNVKRFGLSEDELDLHRADERLAALWKVLGDRPAGSVPG